MFEYFEHMPTRFPRSTAFETAYDRDIEREPSYGRRQPIPLVATGTAKALYEKRQAERLAWIPVVKDGK